MAVQRLQKELRLLAKDPLPSITARPDVKNILVWHYVLEGDAASEYAGGVYHGKITFPSQYPFRPPAIAHSHHFAPRFGIGCRGFSAEKSQ